MSSKATLKAAKKAGKSMLVAVQGCSHGCLGTIYATVKTYAEKTGQQPRVLLLCGDFQALRSKHDYASLAVPAKYRQLGAFYKYYTGEKKAPLLTIVIGGNHEASNYMWELYHGGWLAPNIYYLGAAGSVYVDGIRIVGASGIYNGANYGKGHFERVPYQGSTLRSVYHIRQYDVAKLMHLPERDNTIFLSHDWPTTIPRHGNTAALLRRKTYFRAEVESDTLGSPPLLTLLRHIKPAHWFSAHLHVKFAAVYKHQAGGSRKGLLDVVAPTPEVSTQEENPDEIRIDDDDEPVPAIDNPAPAAHGVANPDEIAIDDDLDDAPGPAPQSGNPDEIALDEDIDGPTEVLAPTPNGLPDPASEPPDEARQDMKVDESVDFVEAARKDVPPTGVSPIPSDPTKSPTPPTPPLQNKRSRSRSAARTTEFLALDKCGQGKDFIQFLDIPSPQGIDTSVPPRITYDPHWLAVTRAFHPYLPLEMRPGPLPSPFESEKMVQAELARIKSQGLLVPRRTRSPSPRVEGQEAAEEEAKVELVWDKGAIDVGRVQKFWPTAPAEGQPGGSPSAWYTNPQTEAFCGMLGIENKINPAPR